MSTDIVLAVEANPVTVLTNAKTYSSFYDAMKAEVEAHVPDLTTASGRKAIASLARKVATTKVAIDDAGKLLNEEARLKINAVDEARRKIRQELDDLRDLARKPLTDWEAAEEMRVDFAKRLISHIQDVGNGMIGGEPYSFGILFRELDEKIPAEITEYLGEYEQIARDAARASRERLNDAFAAHEKAEADRIELERLRAEAFEREEKDRLAREAKELAEAERVAAERAKQEAERAAQIETARIAAIAKAAEDAARAEAERVANDARLAQEVAHAEALAAEKRRADEAEAARKAEADKVAKEAADREAKQRAEDAEAKRIADEQTAREKDRAHRGKIMGETKSALMSVSKITEEQAKLIVLAMTGGNIPNVTLRF